MSAFVTWMNAHPHWGGVIGILAGVCIVVPLMWWLEGRR